jgi:hypothetical protein
MRAELDLFSGRPNPIWELNAEESVELVKRLETLPEAKGGTVRDQLGYRGIVLTARTDDLAGFTSLVVSAGVVLARDADGSKRWFVDRGRALERWLLETARGRVDPAIQRLIDQELNP